MRSLALLVVVAPLVWPVLPERSMVDRDLWSKTFYKDEIGWPELVAQTAAAWRSLPAAERRGRAGRPAAAYIRTKTRWAAKGRSWAAPVSAPVPISTAPVLSATVPSGLILT